MAFSTTAKNAMLNALTVDRIQLHDDAPGAAGDENVVADTYVAATFSAASGGERALATAVEYTELTPSQAVTYLSAWTHSGVVFIGSVALTGDQEANGDGEYTVTTGTKLTIT